MDLNDRGTRFLPLILPAPGASLANGMSSSRHIEICGGGGRVIQLALVMIALEAANLYRGVEPGGEIL